MQKIKLLLAVGALFGAGIISVVASHGGRSNPPDIIRYVSINDLDNVRSTLSTNSSQVRAVNAIDGSTPLHVAAYRGYPQMVELLVQAGADVDQLDKEGFPPLAEAVLSGGQHRKEIVHSLLAAGANPDLKLPDGQTVKQLAESIHGAGSNLVAILNGKRANFDGRIASARE